MSVGIRELRRSASAILRRVEAGEVVEVTNHGRPVARLVPLQEPSSVARLVAEGIATPASGDLLEMPSQPALRGQASLSEMLAEMRADER